MGLISLGCIGQKVQFCDLQPGLTQALGLGVTTGTPGLPQVIPVSSCVKQG